MDGLEWCGLLVDYCDVFISCLDFHSDGTHSLQRIHWWVSDVMLHFSKSDEVTNSSTFWMVWGWVLFSILHLLCTKMFATLLLQLNLFIYFLEKCCFLWYVITNCYKSVGHPEDELSCYCLPYVHDWPQCSTESDANWTVCPTQPRWCEGEIKAHYLQCQIHAACVSINGTKTNMFQSFTVSVSLRPTHG